MRPVERKLKWSVLRFCLAIAVVVGLIVWITVRESGAAAELKEALIENCETGPTRKVLNEIVHSEIKESHSPLTEKVEEALHLTPKEGEQIIQAQNKVRKERLHELSPSQCKHLYK